MDSFFKETISNNKDIQTELLRLAFESDPNKDIKNVAKWECKGI